MEPWHIWIIVALIFFIIEIFTPSFAVACISIGAVCAAISTLCDVTLTYQIIVFALGTLLAFLLVRPLALRFLTNKSKMVKTNVDALIGRQAIVSEEIKPVVGGRVQVDGDDWKAVTADNKEIPVGKLVRIIKIDSIILTVEEV